MQSRPMTIRGLGPHGEIAAPPEQLNLREEDQHAARARRFTAAVVLHTTESDWSKQQLAGIVTTLGQYSAVVVDVIDCTFSIEAQIDALDRVVEAAPDAVISIPIGNTAVAEAHRTVSRAGIRLLLMDNAPVGLLPGTDYVTVVSADNFGLGQIAAKVLSGYIPPGGIVGILAYGVDFFATNEREIAFGRWMDSERADVHLVRAEFADLDGVDGAVAGILDSTPRLHGLFAVWDEPAIRALTTLRTKGLEVPITTIDLGNDAAIEMANGGLIKGNRCPETIRPGLCYRRGHHHVTHGLATTVLGCPARIVSDGAKRH